MRERSRVERNVDWERSTRRASVTTRARAESPVIGSSSARRTVGTSPSSPLAAREPTGPIPARCISMKPPTSRPSPRKAEAPAIQARLQVRTGPGGVEGGGLPSAAAGFRSRSPPPSPSGGPSPGASPPDPEGEGRSCTKAVVRTTGSPMRRRMRAPGGTQSGSPNPCTRLSTTWYATHDPPR
jgi:hypothetical protein